MNLSKYSDKHILALHRAAKKSAHVFFRDPRAMMKLREELERRGL